MIDRNLSQIPIIEDQARDAIRRIGLNNQALLEQLRVAEEFAVEEIRSQNKSIAYELAALGIDRIGDVDEATDQGLLRENLRKLLMEEKTRRNKEGEDIDSFLDSMDG